jgi:hypothetical protein
MAVTVMSIFAPLHEFFFLERAARVAASSASDQRARVDALRKAAAWRLQESLFATSSVASCVLCRDAVAMLARARAAQRDASLDFDDLRRLDGAGDVPDLPVDQGDETGEDARRVREALAAGDALYLDRLDRGDLARLRVALRRTARALGEHIEARSPQQIRAIRRGRLVALLVVAVAIVGLGAWWSVAPVNIAVGKPVHASSHIPTAPDESELVDGRHGFVFGVHTTVEESPHVDIDLLDVYAIDRIAVYNRADGWWDECLPLVVELSRDGTHFAEIGRRTEYFGFDVPWTIVAPGPVGRVVRLRVEGRGYLALRRVEIFGKKLKS